MSTTMRAVTLGTVAALAAGTGASAQGAGFVEGKLVYPSDGIPKDMRVCAHDLDMRTTTCTSRHVRRSSGWGYRLAVPAGRYHVWAATREMRGYKAYYSDFVTCGLRAGCPSHRPIEVEVRPGETTRNVDPADWYNT